MAIRWILLTAHEGETEFPNTIQQTLQTGLEIRRVRNLRIQDKPFLVVELTFRWAPSKFFAQEQIFQPAFLNLPFQVILIEMGYLS
jgi:hypothetical protein